MNPYYKDYAEYLGEIFPGVKVQKLSLDAGFSCPNRDGTIGRGGCAYCNVASFAPAYCDPTESIAVQIEKGKAFFSRKYPQMKYLAYFQAYTGTHSADIDRLVALYDEALAQPDIVGLVIGTRPDCLPDALIRRLARLANPSPIASSDMGRPHPAVGSDYSDSSDMGRPHPAVGSDYSDSSDNPYKPVFIEIGAETSRDDTLRRVNRGHTWVQVEDAARRCAAAGLRVGLHLIAGLPGECDDDVLETVRLACALPIDTLKLHQLQIIRGTRLAVDYEKQNNSRVRPVERRGEAEERPVERRGEAEEIRLYTPESYMALCRRIIEIVPKSIAIERFVSSAPADMLIAPRWGIKNHVFTSRLLASLSK